ncbi:unnamed protein product [Callosobruchus maculatus]|uniref:G-protein coupled receptors family 1 profile domain-containing protein n=1 Tax=Callosobruchus maculatus TaxID=64391 RepID=A0A653BJW2_CALMS|nr:unnamed protein product [Callosobruchus maculatus]
MVRYGRWVTRRVALITIAAIWLLAALISFVPISLGLHRPPQPLVYNAGGQHYATCALDLTPTYAVVSSCISFYKRMHSIFADMDQSEEIVLKRNNEHNRDAPTKQAVKHYISVKS